MLSRRRGLASPSPPLLRSIHRAASFKPLPVPLRTIGAELGQQIRQALIDAVFHNQTPQPMAPGSIAFGAADGQALVAVNDQIAQRLRAT